MVKGQNSVAQARAFQGKAGRGNTKYKNCEKESVKRTNTNPGLIKHPGVTCFRASVAVPGKPLVRIIGRGRNKR